MTPREKSPLLQSLILGISRQAVESKRRKASFALRTILLTNVNGDKSRLTLSSPRLNQGMPVDSFRFTPPEGTDILTPEQFRQVFK